MRRLTITLMALLLLTACGRINADKPVAVINLSIPGVRLAQILLPVGNYPPDIPSEYIINVYPDRRLEVITAD